METATSNYTIQEPKTITTLSRKEKLAAMQKKSSKNGNPVQDSLAPFRRVRRTESPSKSKRTKTHVKKVLQDVNIACNTQEEKEEEEDEKAEVEERIIALQKIVPGGEELVGEGIDDLFEKTAGYILSLQFQVQALKVLASIVEGSEKEKMKLGG